MSPQARLQELLADRALQGLDAQELAEMRQLGDSVTDFDDYSLAAAAVQLAFSGVIASMPSAVRRRLDEDAAGLLDS